MADIELRFHSDMLVLTAPIDAALARQGVDVDQDREFINLIEPDTVADAFRLEMAAGTPCLVTNTAGIAPARLAHHGMDDRITELATAAITVAKACKPQHILVEVGPCGLPLDASLKASLNEHRKQYARVARAFAGLDFDAFYLSGFENTTDLKCALMGLRQVTERPIFASVCVGATGVLPSGEILEDALEVMAEYEANVAGIVADTSLDEMAALLARMEKLCPLPLLAELVVRKHEPKQGQPTPENPYFAPDTMVQAGATLRAAGAQFLRVRGDATAAYTGVLATTMHGLDVVRADVAPKDGSDE